MNLQSKKARIPIAALGATALACGVGAMFNPALAVGQTLSFLGATNNAATSVAIDPTGSASAALTMFGVKVAGAASSDTRPLEVQVLSAPSSGALFAERVSGNGAPVYNSTSTVSNTTTSSATASGATTLTFTAGPGFVVDDNIYNGATFIGTVNAVDTSAHTVTLAAGAAAAIPASTSLSATHGLQPVLANASAATNLTSYAVGDNVYLGASVAGTYTFQLFKDTNNDGAYQANTDDVTPTFTLTVKNPSDAFTLNAPSTVPEGTMGPMVKVNSSLTDTDVRGGTPSALSTAVANLLNVNITDNGQAAQTLSANQALHDTSVSFTSPLPNSWTTGTVLYIGNTNTVYGTISGISGTTVTLAAPGASAAENSGTTIRSHGVLNNSSGNAAPTYDSTNGTYRYLSVDGSTKLLQGQDTPHTLTSTLTFNGGSSLGAQTTEVTSNGVAALALALKSGQDTNTTVTGNNVKVRAGTGTVTYTATATDNSNPAQTLSGKSVTFTLAGVSGTTLADLTANGAPVPTTGANAGQVVATTDSSGVATLTVVSGKTADTNAYSVTASSGSANSSTFSTAYQAPAVSGLVITSSAADLTPTVGTASVTVKGKVTDQFGQTVQPTTGNQQVNVSGSGVTATAALSNGTFSYTFTPATAPAAGTTTPLTFSYSGGTNPSAVATIQWASTTPAAKITLTAPSDGATGITLQDNTPPNAAQISAFGNTTGAVSGTVSDANNAGLAFKTVTLTGDDGVWFATSATPDATHQLSKTLTVTTSNTGAITGAYVFYTKAGTAKITATSGTATASSTVSTAAPLAGQAYKITVNDATGTPGSTLILTGKVTDIFGNGVPLANVDLSTGSTTVGVLGDDTVQTNSDGVWSSTFITGTNQAGDVTVTATIAALTSNPTVDPAYATAGITTLVTGDYQSTGKVTVAAVKLAIGSTDADGTISSGAGGAKVTIDGTFMPNASITILAKASGASSYSLIGTATAGSDGKYSATFTVKKSTSFISQSQGVSSATKKITVKSSVTLTAKSSKAGKVTLHANGNPNGKYKVSIYRSKSGTDPRVAYKTSDASGVIDVTVSAPKGTDKYYATFTATGTSKGTSKTVSVKVK